VHDLVDGFYTFNIDVAQSRLPAKGNGPLSPQNILPSREETGLKWRRNPLQKALSHKEDRNNRTPPELLSHPPQGYNPLFHSVFNLSEPPLFLRVF